MPNTYATRRLGDLGAPSNPTPTAGSRSSGLNDIRCVQRRTQIQGAVGATGVVMLDVLTEHRDLLAQHQYFDVLGRRRARQQHEPGQNNHE